MLRACAAADVCVNLEGILTFLTGVLRSQVNDLVQMLHELTTSLEAQEAAQTS